MEEHPSPYVCHVFVCTNDRKGVRKSCADGNSPSVKAMLKDAFKNRGWTGRVRVSLCGCMGLCKDGPNVMLYPQRVWYSGVTPDTAHAIVEKVASFVASHDA